MANIDEGSLFQRDLNVCFSGHRPNKLPNAGDLSKPAMRSLYQNVLNTIENAIAEGKVNFIHGMMSGFDIVAAEAILEIKKKHPHIKLISVLPFQENFFATKEWNAEWLSRSSRICKESDCCVCLSSFYYPHVYCDRNNWMLAHSSLLICYQTSLRGSTAYTVKHAKKNGIPIVNLALSRDKAKPCRQNQNG